MVKRTTSNILNKSYATPPLSKAVSKPKQNNFDTIKTDVLYMDHTCSIDSLDRNDYGPIPNQG